MSTPLRSVLTVPCNTLRDHLAHSAIHVQHIHVYASDLRIEVAADRCTRRNVGLHDVANNLDRFSVLENRAVFSSLLDDAIPLHHVSPAPYEVKLYLQQRWEEP